MFNILVHEYSVYFELSLEKEQGKKKKDKIQRICMFLKRPGATNYPTNTYGQIIRNFGIIFFLLQV